jgi:hypothetical protein
MTSHVLFRYGSFEISRAKSGLVLSIASQLARGPVPRVYGISSAEHGGAKRLYDCYDIPSRDVEESSGFRDIRKWPRPFNLDLCCVSDHICSCWPASGGCLVKLFC